MGISVGRNGKVPACDLAGWYLEAALRLAGQRQGMDALVGGEYQAVGRVAGCCGALIAGDRAVVGARKTRIC